MESKRVFDLIVIGGGVSGISSVYHLLKNGFKGSIGLLEGRHRLGGRIHTSKTQFEEQKIEIGANWIHGIIDNPIYNILYRRQLVNPVAEPTKSSYNIQAKAKDGQDAASYWVLKVQSAYQNIVQRSTLYFTSAKEDGMVEACNDSLGKFLQTEIDKWIENEVKNESVLEVVRLMFDSLLNRETCITGAHSMDDVSLQYFGAYDEFLGGNLTIPKGYYSLIEVLLEDIHSMCDAKAHFQVFNNSKVTNIIWPGIDNSDKPKSASDLLKLKCANGETFECGHLIVTIPLGCLKKEARTLFEPPLPSYKLECIERMGFGTVDKIFLEYSSKGVISQVFTHDGVTTDEMFLLWDRTDQHRWYRKVFSIYWVSDHCIMLWATGKEADTLETLTEDQVNTEVTEQLRLFFKNANFPRADHVIVTRWGQDEFSQGSYSYIGTSGSPEDIKQLAMPIYRNQADSKPVVAFAGEATHHSFFSTVHGAFLSGQNCAKHFVTAN